MKVRFALQALVTIGLAMGRGGPGPPQFPPVDGGNALDSGVGIDAGPCGASTCAGCCDSLTGQCELGTLDVACGVSGDACVACAPDSSCQAYSCNKGCGPTNCSWGCCVLSTCEPLDGGYCGLPGNACQPSLCTASQVCVGGACQTPCSANTCRGCCVDLLVCDPSGLSDGSCGLNGGPCVQCQGGQTCLAGSCVALDAGTPDGGASDGGAVTDGGRDAGPTASKVIANLGCGCQSTNRGSAFWLALLIASLATKHQRRSSG